MVELYNMMYKRKSFRTFKSDKGISKSELEKITHFIDDIGERIAIDIPMNYKIVPVTETSCKRGEYCILIYSNNDNMSLLNIGYVFAQLDFYMASMDIGSCWYGMGKPNQTEVSGRLPYVIMIAIGKATKDEFRKDHTKAKRKSNEEICISEPDSSLINYVKYSPSACNSQPWLLEANRDKLTIILSPKEKMIIPKDKIIFYNTIDMGIMIFSCEIWLRSNLIYFKRHINYGAEPYKSGDIIAEFFFKS